MGIRREALEVELHIELLAVGSDVGRGSVRSLLGERRLHRQGEGLRCSALGIGGGHREGLSDADVGIRGGLPAIVAVPSPLSVKVKVGGRLPERLRAGGRRARRRHGEGERLARDGGGYCRAREERRFPVPRLESMKARVKHRGGQVGWIVRGRQGYGVLPDVAVSWQVPAIVAVPSPLSVKEKVGGSGPGGERWRGCARRRDRE